MSAAPRHFRIFLSSPGDVASERALVLQVIDNLRTEPLLRDVNLTPVAWDDPNSRTPMLAMKTPQQAIDEELSKPSDCDIVVVIFWSRMGAPLDVDSHGTKLDGTQYLSGTEWEYLDAVRGAKENGTGRPLIVIYRRTERIALDPVDPLFDQKLEQWRRVENFFRQFYDPVTGVFKKGFNEYATPDDFRKAFEKDIKVLLNRLIGRDGIHSKTGKTGDPIVLWKGSPFPGLRAFLPADEPIFFGRGRETDALVKRVSESRFVAVVGASGSGKSSLVGAGLIPRLMNNALDGSKDWKWLRFTPGGLGDNPFMALAAELKNLTERHGWNARQIVDKLASDPSAIDEIAVAALTDQPTWAELLLFIDQFEELFTLAKPEYVAPFAVLLNAFAAFERVHVVVTLRSDFYHRCVDVPGLVGLLQSGSYPLGVPDAFAFLEMIERPAERAGLAFEADLPKRMVRDTGAEPGGLALLAYTLDELYERCKNKRTLSAADYDALEGVQGAIGTRAENTFTRLDPEAQAAFTQVFRNLVEVDENGLPTRERMPLSHFNGAAQRLIVAFVEARLLTTADDSNRVALVEVAHEALFRTWNRLKAWIETTRSALYTLQQVKLAAHDWEASGYSDGFLWSDERIRLVEQAVDQLHVDVERTWQPVESAFIYQNWDWIERAEPMHQWRSKAGEKLSTLGDPRKGVGLRSDGLPDIEWLSVSSGKITLRDDEGKSLGDFDLHPFWIAKYPITYIQFQAFLDAPDGFERDEWWNGLETEYRKQAMSEQTQKFASYPREAVSWSQAVAFSRWLNAKLPPNRLPPTPRLTGTRRDDMYIVRLPTEWEWQGAATGGRADLKYPWGADWETGRANTVEAGIERTSGVGLYPGGASPVGALDMAGNVWEWCLNEYRTVKNISLSGTERRALRGGAYYSDGARGALCWSRVNDDPYYRLYGSGFRLVVAAAPL